MGWNGQESDLVRHTATDLEYIGNVPVRSGFWKSKYRPKFDVKFNVTLYTKCQVNSVFKITKGHL